MSALENRTNLACKKRFDERGLNEEHLEFLTCKENLAKWRSLSLLDRCRVFQQEYPGKKISYSAIREVYQNFGIKKRKLQKKYLLSESTLQRRYNSRLQVFPRVLEMIKGGTGTFLWADEATYVSTDFRHMQVWAGPGAEAPTIPDRKIQFSCIAALSGITCTGRVHATITRKKAIKSADFIEFLGLALRTCERLPLIVFVDQHPLHKTAEVQDFCQTKKIVLVYNAPYSSEFNAVERLWLLSKRILRRKVLEAEVQRLRPNQVDKMILESISQVPSKSLTLHVECCLERMEAFVN